MSEETKLSDKLQKIIDAVSKLSVLELADLVKALEEKFDIKAAAAVPTVSVGTASTPTVSVGETEEKTEFEVVVTNAGANKIAVIKTFREFKPELGLKEAKDMVDACPTSLGTMKKDAAAEAKTKLVAAGAQVDLK